MRYGGWLAGGGDGGDGRLLTGQLYVGPWIVSPPGTTLFFPLLAMAPGASMYVGTVMA